MWCRRLLRHRYQTYCKKVPCLRRLEPGEIPLSPAVVNVGLDTGRGKARVLRKYVCHDCGKTGHIHRQCKSKEKGLVGAKDAEASGVVIAATGSAQSQPQLWVTVSVAQGKGTLARIQVVPDTGAQVCVARPDLLETLGIKPASLACRSSLQDVVNVSLKPMGAFTCRIQ